MSVTLSRKLVCEVRWPKLAAKAPPLASTLMTAPTLEEMDQQLERHIDVVMAAFLKHSTAITARAAGKLRAEYRAAREALIASETKPRRTVLDFGGERLELEYAEDE